MVEAHRVWLWAPLHAPHPVLNLNQVIDLAIEFFFPFLFKLRSTLL